MINEDIYPLVRERGREKREWRKEKNETIGFAAWFFVRNAVNEKKNVTKR